MNTNEDNKPRIDVNGELYDDSMPINTPTRLRDHSGYRVSPFVYEHGFFNGVLEVDGEEFYEFIQSSDQKKMAYVRLKRINNTIEELKKKILEVSIKTVEFISIIHTTKHKIPVIEVEIEETFKNREKCDQQKNELEDEKNRINPYYNKLIATIFIACAIVFIGAEVKIIQDIFRNILEVPIIDSYFIAFAIALSSFAMKPAIDRIFEEPFLMGKNRMRIKWLLSFFSVLLLIALGFLGYFRSDAIQLKTKISLYPDQDLRMEWLEIIGSNSIQIFYVFSSILLAISGAICFSIGIPVFKLAKKRQEIEKILIEKTDMQNKLTSEINMKRQEIAKAKTDQEIAEQQLNLLDDKVNLQTSLDKAFQEELKIWESMFENQTKAEISWYEEGRKRGNKYTLADELIISLYDFPNGGYKQSENRSKEEGNPVPPVNGKYLHEKVRSLIDYNLNRKPKLNGHNE